MAVTFVYKADTPDLDVADIVCTLEANGRHVRAIEKRDRGLVDVLTAPANLIVVAGGDGTVAEVIRAMPDLRVPIAILPTGTANNIARSFGISRNVHEALHALDAMTPRRLDLFAASGAFGSHILIESAAVGCVAVAQSRARTIPPGQDRIAAARKAVAEAIAEADPIMVELELDGHGVPLQCLGVEILNIPRIGPALPLLAHADPGDGMLDVACVTGREAFLDWLVNPTTTAPVQSRRARNVRLLSPGGTLRLDDEFYEDVSELNIRPLNEFAIVLAPADHHASSV